MAHVTSIILATGYNESGVKELLKYIEINSSFGLVSIDDEKLPQPWTGGSKPFEADLYLGGINYLDVDDMIEFARQIKWDDPEQVQFMIKVEGDMRFKLINLAR